MTVDGGDCVAEQEGEEAVVSIDIHSLARILYAVQRYM